MADILENRCPNCFEENQGKPTCPHCGWKVGDRPASPLYLAPGTPLGDDYVIGRVLGHGGFGITYLGWDVSLNTRVAIKEFLPDDFAGRNPQNSQVTVYSYYEETFQGVLGKFREEAQILAKFHHYPGIVTVFKYLSANDTGYMIMDFVEGITLEQYLGNHDNKIPWQQALMILTPVMDALREVHGAGLLHRDIAPANIYITHGKQVRLLDFGSARQAPGARGRNLTVLLKPGYTPEEQRTGSNKQGAWTDVYALCATLYRCVTGQLPPDSLNRTRKDELQPPSALGVELSEKDEAILMKGLAIYVEDRWQSIEEMQRAWLEAPPAPEEAPPAPEEAPPAPEKKRSNKVYIVVVLIVIILVLIGTGWWFISRPAELTVHTNVPEAVIYIDGERIGLSGVAHEIDAGEHKMRVEKPGYEPHEEPLTLAAGEEGRILNVQLTPKPAQLLIDSDFPDAVVYINGKAVGSPGTGHTLDAGEYDVRVERLGYESSGTRVTLTPGGKQTIPAELIPEKGELIVRSNVEDDTVYINEKPVGSTGRDTHKLRPGEYTIRVEKEEFRPAKETITLVPGERKDITVRLERIKKPESKYRPGTIFRDKLRDGSKGPRMMVIPAGTFRMGSPSGEPNRDGDEGPRHRVRISKPFAIGVTEVTFEEYDRFTAATGQELLGDHDWGRGKRPVLNVSWSDARAYAKWLSKQSGEKYRLPTEAEWEYAARAGTTSPYPWGKNRRSACGHANTYDLSGEERHHRHWKPLHCDDGQPNTAPVGSYPANKFGLFDMIGNVWEWTADCWHKNYRNAPTDGSSWNKENGGNCSRRVARGGSLFGKPWFLRSANRFELPKERKAVDVGFRLVRTIR